MQVGLIWQSRRRLTAPIGRECREFFGKRRAAVLRYAARRARHIEIGRLAYYYLAGPNRNRSLSER